MLTEYDLHFERFALQGSQESLDSLLENHFNGHNGSVSLAEQSANRIFREVAAPFSKRRFLAYANKELPLPSSEHLAHSQQEDMYLFLSSVALGIFYQKIGQYAKAAHSYDRAGQIITFIKKTLNDKDELSSWTSRHLCTCVAGAMLFKKVGLSVPAGYLFFRAARSAEKQGEAELAQHYSYLGKRAFSITGHIPTGSVSPNFILSLFDPMRK